ncbi:hypothetical protein IW261DRAFT_1420280 [Armillaria novae-zelandiae]|uniref:Uncharacterized protein n=1 Tax=Armillaria novae-zelandiae TaxID=153914 RepID=A0AA39P7D4_9AGAR|nr:hypothetical protein IW261DRAFT_1420280 [Armillaria novae-zelandiae]
MGKEGMWKVHGLGVGLRVLAEDDPSSSGEEGCIHHGTAGFWLEVLVQLSLSMTEDIQLVFSGNDFCLKTMYQRLAREGMALLKWWGALQMVPLKCGVMTAYIPDV